MTAAITCGHTSDCGSMNTKWPASASTVVCNTSPTSFAAFSYVGKVHDRMRVILDPDDYDLWLDPAIDDRKKLEKLLVPFRGKGMTAGPISTFVNNVTNQGQSPPV